jgi:hypothetical protein
MEGLWQIKPYFFGGNQIIRYFRSLKIEVACVSGF